MMKRLFSTTCIPADAELAKRTYLSRFVRDENGNVTLLSIILIATGAVLSGIAWDLNSFEYRRVALQQIADRAVLAAADLDQTLPPEEVVRDYFAKAGYADVVSSVNVDEGLNFRTVSVDVHGLISAQSVRGSYSGETTFGGNASIDAPIAARQRFNQNRSLDSGMTYDQILEDVIERDFTRGGVTPEESDRIAELRILLRDSVNTGSNNLGESNFEQQEVARLLAAQTGTSTLHEYVTDEARAIAATLTQADARALVDLQTEMAEHLADRTGNMAGYTDNYDATPDQRSLLDATGQRRLEEIDQLIAALSEAEPDIPEELADISALVGQDIVNRLAENAALLRDAGVRRELTAQDILNDLTAQENMAHAYNVLTADGFDAVNEAIRDDQWKVSQRENGNYLEMRAFSEAEERVNNVEISLVLDISGSMGDPSVSVTDGDSTTKMHNLRDAARTFVDAVINDSTEDLVSISLIPYSEHVSAGPAIMDEFNVNRTHNYSHCIEFSDADFNTTEMGPSAAFDQVQHFYWGTTSWNRRTNSVCPTGQYEDVVAFSQDTWELKNQIGQLVPRGSTSIFTGMKWAAGLLDPSFQPINQNLAAGGHSDAVFANRPVAFDDRETLKTVILMTDGQNHYSKRINPSVYANSSHWAHWNNNSFDWWVNRNVYSSQRQYWSSPKYWPEFGDQLLSSVCDAAKQNNIVIWSIGFEVTAHSANVMRDCASSPSHYFGVEGVEIKEAFTAIARQINQLRLTQ